MPRTLDPNCQTVVDSGHREDHTAIVLTLSDDDETVLYFATGEVVARLDGEDQLFVGKLRENDPLKLSLDVTDDGCTLKVDNSDKVFGQQLTSASTALDGATAIQGLIIVNEDTGAAWFDPKIPGDIVAGQISESEVPLNFLADIYAAQVVGETVASVFPYQSTPATAGVIVSDPNDILDPNRGPGGDDSGLGPLIKGRLPDDPIKGFLVM